MQNKMKNFLQPFIFPLLGAMTGYVAFSGYWPLIAFNLLLFPLMQATETRAQSFLLCLAYYLAATRSLPAAAAAYVGSGLWLGVVLWGLGCSISSSFHALLWHKEYYKRAVFFMLSLVLLSIPPFGIVGWASPFTATGVLFPALGYWGFLGFFVIWLYFIMRKWIGLAILCISVLDVNYLYSKFKSPENNWEGIQTFAGAPYQPKADEFQKIFPDLAKDRKQNLLFPESSVVGTGAVDSLTDLWDASRPKGQTIAFGSEQTDTNGDRHQILVFLSGDEYQIYRQRQAVPLTMWRPGFTGSYKSVWFENPVVSIGSETYAPLLCYESFLVWPIVHSAAYRPTRILLASNLWWAEGSDIEKIQKSIVHVWARLFKTPYSVAVNHA